jgi:ribosomal protein S18 acetylase RimI-like enzyme
MLSHPRVEDGSAALWSAFVLYRPYHDGDFAALYALEEACFEPPFRFSRGYLRQLVANAQTATWVAEEDGSVAGFATVQLREEAAQQAAYIETIEVGRQWRGLGVGSELLRRLEGSAQAAGARLLWLHVDAENASAIRLYEAHGYSREGTEENFYPRGRTALVYAKPLAEVRESAAAAC